MYADLYQIKKTCTKITNSQEKIFGLKKKKKKTKNARRTARKKCEIYTHIYGDGKNMMQIGIFACPFLCRYKWDSSTTASTVAITVALHKCHTI